MQYFLLRSHSQGDSKSLFSLSMIIFSIWLLNMSTFVAVQSTNDGSIENVKVGDKTASNKVIAIAVKDSNKDVDIVSYGEDCSSDGPYCDETRNLVCDPVEEICICDLNQGYIHINDIPGGVQQYFPIEYDVEGNPYYSLNGNVCISKQDVIERSEQLLGLGKKGPSVDTNIQQEMPSSSSPKLSDEFDLDDDFDDMFEKDSTEDIWTPPESSLMPNAVEGGRDSNSIYDEFLKTAGIKRPKYDEERLQRFELGRKLNNRDLPENKLIVQEILNYRGGPVSLDGLESFFEELLSLHFGWRKNRLSNSICSLLFDVDRDELFTYEEYVIALYSEKIRALVIPKVFLNLIGPLIEDSCISMSLTKMYTYVKQDVQALDHDPETLISDYYTLDSNLDGCISKDEFSEYANTTCWVNWLTDYLKKLDLQLFLAVIDPTPEEMYIRRVMQNERLGINWKIMDKNKDGFISTEELSSDLALYELSTTRSKKEAKELLRLMDKNGDGKISMDEVKLQMSIPEFSKNHQLEWLESLYKLFDSDEDEVNEYFEAFTINYGVVKDQYEDKEDKINTKESGIDRLFTIFDRNRNEEMDKVEFKLVLELIKKFVVFDLLNETVDSIDSDSNRKVTIFEYQEFFKNASSTFRTYFKNLLALEDEIEEIEKGDEGEDYDDEYEEDENEEDDEEDKEENENYEAIAVSSTKLSKRAAASNETLMVYKLFIRLDSNSDGFITKDDFYSYASSFKAKKSTSELKQEFLQLDLNKDGLLTAEDSQDYVIPLDFNKFKETADAFSEEVFPNDLEDRFPKVDANKDGIIQKREFKLYSSVLFDSDEEHIFLDWVEMYLGDVPNQVDPASEKAFAEFDTNCSRFISESEFKSKLEELRMKSKTVPSCSKSPEDMSRCFQILDLNKDGKVSHNEFNLLVLRTGKTLSST